MFVWRNILLGDYLSDYTREETIRFQLICTPRIAKSTPLNFSELAIEVDNLV